ncbi:hypothetical protein J4234_01570 [Candidatus Woesearchaeota archaeon]|nr:hypothetical protein [Candidatus Woesearchaeota archaeon]
MAYKPLQRAYDVANEFLQSLFKCKSKDYTLALGIEGPETVFFLKSRCCSIMVPKQIWIL